jgi:hypothetical protein
MFKRAQISWKHIYVVYVVIQKNKVQLLIKQIIWKYFKLWLIKNAFNELLNYSGILKIQEIQK